MWFLDQVIRDFPEYLEHLEHVKLNFRSSLFSSLLAVIASKCHF